MLGSRGLPVEWAAVQVCMEAGGRVGVDRFVRDLDLGAFNQLDGRRIEVIIDGLSFWHGAQLVATVRHDAKETMYLEPSTEGIKLYRQGWYVMHVRGLMVITCRIVNTCEQRFWGCGRYVVCWLSLVKFSKGR